MTLTAALSCSGVSLHFGGVAALSNVSFELAEGEVLGLIGPNGAGKSSLINCITGFYTPHSGAIHMGDVLLSGSAPRQIALHGVARTFQQADSMKGMGARDVVLLGRDRFMPSGFLRYAVRWPSAVRAEREALDRVLRIADALGIADEIRRNTPYESLPYGMRKLVDLGRALACDPKVLLMDEPAAGLTESEKMTMAEVIRRVKSERGITQLLVDHDLAFVNLLTSRMLVLDAGNVVAQGPNAEVLANQDVIDSYIGRPEESPPIEVTT